ncbi:MAG: acetyltransferase [Zetaproteobacteria bacterium CG_4_9_14_3_um_filter_53_7]|nr:MAG: acetyltransferase [Zetaproteobacteria bacterium CG_4_9_14_3_um_filter_53_7]
MFLKNAANGDLAQVVHLSEVTDPYSSTVTVRFHAGEEAGDPVKVEKSGLTFPSGEALPKCWLDPHYRISF